MKRTWTFLLLLGATLTFSATLASGGPDMKLTSSAFQDGGKIPIQYVMPGAGGQNISLSLSWTEVPPGTQSFALSIVDPHQVARNWVHWLVINIPAGVTSLEEGASRKKMPPGALELKSSFGDVGYGGPQPPRGTGDHPYVVTIYALSVPRLELRPDTDLARFKAALEGKVLATAAITGYFGR